MQGEHMKKTFLAFVFCCAGAGAAQAQQTNDNPWQVTSVTVAGAPILTHHFQSGDDNYVDHHTIGTFQVNTAGRGNWALYYLGPNSVDKTSVGAGYVTNPYTIPISGPVQLELSGALGLVSGYQDYPVPLLAAQARLALYENGPWNAGVTMAAMPYIAEDRVTGKNHFGIVGTTPFLSVRYSFQ
jgi:hypothetical protein